MSPHTADHRDAGLGSLDDKVRGSPTKAIAISPLPVTATYIERTGAALSDSTDFYLPINFWREGTYSLPTLH